LVEYKWTAFSNTTLWGLLASSLGGTVPGALGAAGVPSADSGILGHAIAGNPTGALFGSFPGENPMAQLVALTSTLPGWTALPPSIEAKLLEPHFFASLVERGFGVSISRAFLIAGGLCTAAAVIPALRGKRYIYGVVLNEPGSAAAPLPETAPASPVANPPTPVASTVGTLGPGRVA